MVDLVFISLELGLLTGLIVLGVFLTFRVLNYPDLSVDGSFVTGAAAAALAIQSGVPGETALLVGLVAGLCAGVLTAFLHTVLGIEKILSGILALGILYTINLRLMDGPNLSLLNQETVMGVMQAPFNHVALIAVLFAIVVFAKFFIDWFLSTGFGLQVRATGDNEATARSFGINPNVTKFAGVVISNGLMGLAGALFAQYMGFADVNMGIGNIILGLAALMLGEAILSSRKIATVTLAIIVGSVLYQFIVNIALRLGLAGTDLKLITALIVIFAIMAKDGERYITYGKRIFNTR
ncbi:ABC transporter permease [Patescibacteria group bacterium]|nr:ABC transporter permease [Patescibacteria group bacterium]